LRTRSLVALGIVAFLAFLAAQVPASFVIAKLRLPPGAELTDVDGTLWKGRARATLALPGGTLALDDLEWTFKPLRLIAGRVAYDVTARAPSMEASARLSRGFRGFEIADVTARGDAKAIILFAPLAAAWQPQGAITLAAPVLEWDGKELRGEGRAEWRGASLALSQVRPLGSYRAEFRGAGGPAKVTLATLEGPLRLTGDGTLSGQGRLNFSGEARGEGTSAQALEPLLDLMGPKRADGSRVLRFN
jgi:general secretion pathway protein N